SSRFSKPLLPAGAVTGGGNGSTLRPALRLAGGSGATGGAPMRGSASPVGRRSAASRRCAISARFWSADDMGGAGARAGIGGGGGGGGGATARSGERIGGGFGASL